MPSPGNDRDLNDPYFAGFNQESRYINFAVNLGLDSAHADEFEQTYGELSYAQVIDRAYDEIIGDRVAAANNIDVAAGQAYLGRVENIDFLTRLAAGAEEVALFVKAALVGQILSIGASTTFGVYSEATTRYLLDLAEGGLTSDRPVDLVGFYSEVGGDL
nr:hypothetical protein [Caulobacter sp. NIBR2454]